MVTKEELEDALSELVEASNILTLEVCSGSEQALHLALTIHQEKILREALGLEPK